MAYLQTQLPPGRAATPGTTEIDFSWLVTLLACCIILLAAGVFAAWFEYHTIGPDILGFASSIVRQSKYISVPKRTSGERGAERAGILKDHQVMMQDVRPNGPVGKIALGTALEKRAVEAGEVVSVEAGNITRLTKWLLNVSYTSFAVSLAIYELFADFSSHIEILAHALRCEAVRPSSSFVKQLNISLPYAAMSH